MNFKTPFKVLTTAALIGTLSLSAVAPGAASAAEKTVTAQAETPANFAIEKVILVKGDSKISVSFDTYIDALGNEKALNGYELAYVVAANGEVFALDTYVDFYEEGNTEKEVVEKLSKAGKTSEVTEVKDGAFNDGKLEPVEDTAATVKVESVSAIEATIVEVTFPALAEAKTDVTVEVKDSKGVVREVVARDIAKGATKAQFDFKTTVKADDLTGVWSVNGVSYSFDELKLVGDLVTAATANNQVKVNSLLTQVGIKNLDTDLIAKYTTKIGTASPAPVWASDVQKLVDAVNKDAAETADETKATKAVADATNQIALLSALQANFDRVNADWIADYSAGAAGASSDSQAGFVIKSGSTANTGVVATGATSPEVPLTYANIQTIIDTVNAEKIVTADTAATNNTSAKQAGVTSLVQQYEKDDVAPATAKADRVKASKAKEAGFRVAEATTENTLYNALVAYAKATPDSNLAESELNTNLKSDYFAAFEGGTVKADLLTAVKGNTIAGIVGASGALINNVDTQIDIIVDAVNTKALEDALDAVGTTATAYDATDADTVKAFSKAFQTLADVTAHETTKTTKFDLATIDTSILEDYANATIKAITKTDAVSDVQTAVKAVNDAKVTNAQVKAINEATTATQVKTALDKLAIPAYVNVPTADKLHIAEQVLELRDTLTAGRDALNKNAVASGNTDTKAKTFVDAEEVIGNLRHGSNGVIKNYNDLLSEFAASEIVDKPITTVISQLEKLDYAKFENSNKAAVAEAFAAMYPTDDNGPVNYSTLAAVKAGVDKAITAVAE